MTIILAMSRNRVIGSGKGMPWSVPDEYRQCLDFVRGQSVIMGRRSFEIFGSHLGETSNFVISRTTKEIRGATVYGSLEQALEKAKETGKTIFSASFCCHIGIQTSGRINKGAVLINVIFYTVISSFEV